MAASRQVCGDALLALLGLDAESKPVQRALSTLAHGMQPELWLGFAPRADVVGADRRYPRALAFAQVTFYAARELDALEWRGPLPFGLSSADTQETLRAKVGAPPVEQQDEA